MPVFWHINPPEMSVSACFGLSHFILIKGRSLPPALPDLLDVILSALVWVILLNSSSSLKSSIVTFVDTPKFFLVTPLRFTKNLLHFWFTLKDGEIFMSVSNENPAIFRLIELENSEAWAVLNQFAHDSQLCIVFWVNTFNYKWSPVFVAGGHHGELTSRWERR